MEAVQLVLVHEVVGGGRRGRAMAHVRTGLLEGVSPSNFYSQPLNTLCF